MPTLLEALEEKYGLKYVSDFDNNEELVSIYVPKMPARMRFVVISLSLNGVHSIIHIHLHSISFPLQRSRAARTQRLQHRSGGRVGGSTEKVQQSSRIGSGTE